jgi:hypothetical protein
VIPRVVHQIWLASERAPVEMMETWQGFCRERGWDYRLWTDERDPLFEPLRHKLEEFQNVAEKIDCMRYLILNQHGGILADAETVVIRPFQENIVVRDFCAMEHELVRPGLISKAVLGFEPGSALLGDCIHAISAHPVGMSFKFKAAVLLSQAAFPHPEQRHRKSKHRNSRNQGMGRLREFRVLPSRHFYPVHWTGSPSPGVLLPRNGQPDPAIYIKHAWHGGRVREPAGEHQVVNPIELAEKFLGIDDASLVERGIMARSAATPIVSVAAQERFPALVELREVDVKRAARGTLTFQEGTQPESQ